MRYILSIITLASLAACESPPTTTPNNGTGVGFGNYEQYQKEKALRDAQLASSAVPAPDAVSAEPLDTPAPILQAEAQPEIKPLVQPQDMSEPQPSSDVDLAAATQAVLSQNSGSQTQSNANNPGISDENDFEAVGTRRTIESDADRLAANKEQYEVAQVTALPKRVGSSGPNIVDYALRSKHPVGTQIYQRTGLNKGEKFKRNCAKYLSTDMAQSAFLDKGGPQRDKLGLDPDGDGFACGWDPEPFRKAVGG